ncbi:hypothetical protein HPB47_010624, partial [Ixodes persulcatus]
EQSASSLTELSWKTAYLELLGTAPVKSMVPSRYKQRLMTPKAKYDYLTRNPMD